MTKMVAIILLQTCMIAGLPRSPVEGVQIVPEDEAERLIDQGMAEIADMEIEEAEPAKRAARGGRRQPAPASG